MDFINKVFFTLFFEEIKVFLPLIFLFFYSIFIFKEKKNWNIVIKLLILCLPFIFIFYHYSYLSNFFSAIGQDSLAELNADFGEAFFYVKTFFTFLFDPEIFKRNRFWLLLGSSIGLAIILYYVIDLFCKKKRINILLFDKLFNLFFFTTFIIAIFSIINVIKINLNIGKELKIVETEFKKNILNFSANRTGDNKLKVITYIGESTAALNFSLYGYPFKTTPCLQSQGKNKKFIKFKKVFATHTHTTPSLKSILSLCIKQNKKDCSLILGDIENNLSIVDIFSKLNINTHLFSTQGFLGGHNLGTKLVLNTKEKYFSSELENRNSEFQGNRYMPEIKDKEFFLKNYCKKNQIFKNESSLVFLHSYAGHGQYAGYLDHTSEKEVFSYPKYINKLNFLGKGSRNFKLIQEYDAAIKYIDGTLKKVVECSIKNSEKENQPLIFIYFADHGEAVASARGHDSSRLTYEMLHVPFFIVFNDVAYNLHKDKFETLNNLKNKDLSLKFLSDVLIYLFDINILDITNQNIVYAHDEFKSLSSDFILDRRDLNGKIKKIQTFWNFKGTLENSELTETQFKNQDTSISLWQLKNYLEKKGLSDKKNIKNLVCQHRANSYITQYKSSLSNGCFETDIFFLKDYVLSTHEIKDEPKLIFDKFLDSSFNKNTLWLDSKNLNLIENCQLGEKWLKKNYQKFLSLLVETPTDSINNINNKAWINCIKKINNIENIDVGYYLPTQLITECSQQIIREKKNYSTKCQKLYSNTTSFLDKTKINSITFDYSGYEFVKSFKNFKNYKWHIWHVDSLKSFNKIFENKNIGIVLLKNNRFTDNLN